MVLIEVTRNPRKVGRHRADRHGAPDLAHVDRKARFGFGHASTARLDELHVQAVATGEFDRLLILMAAAQRVIPRALELTHGLIIAATTDKPPTVPGMAAFPVVQTKPR
jgi:hypothetical protein